MADEEYPNRHTIALDGVLKIGKEVHSLKAQLGKLKGRIESLELMDFQDQLNRLDEKVGKISNGLIEISQESYKIHLTLFGLSAEARMHDMGHRPPSQKTWEQTRNACMNEIQIYYVQTSERINHCKDVQDMANALGSFLKKANKILGDYGFSEVEGI